MQSPACNPTTTSSRHNEARSIIRLLLPSQSHCCYLHSTKRILTNSSACKPCKSAVIPQCKRVRLRRGHEKVVFCWTRNRIKYKCIKGRFEKRKNAKGCKVQVQCFCTVPVMYASLGRRGGNLPMTRHESLERDLNSVVVSVIVKFSLRSYMCCVRRLVV